MEIKNLIDEKIPDNSVKKITAKDVRDVMYAADDKMNDIESKVTSGIIGIISPTDPAPTVAGSYKPQVPGTYTNLGGLVAKEGYDTLFYFNGTTWSKSEVEMPMVQVDGKVESGDTNAVSGGEVYDSQKTVRDISNLSAQLSDNSLMELGSWNATTGNSHNGTTIKRMPSMVITSEMVGVYTVSGIGTISSSYAIVVVVDNSNNVLLSIPGQNSNTPNKVMFEITSAMIGANLRMGVGHTGSYEPVDGYENHYMWNRGTEALPFSKFGSYSVDAEKLPAVQTIRKNNLPVVNPVSGVAVEAFFNEQKTIKESDLTILKGKNLFNKATATVGYIAGSSGVEYNVMDTYRKSDFIPVEQGNYISNFNMRHVAFYDENKVFVDGGYSTQVKLINIANTAVKFIRISIFTINLDGFQIEKGTESTSFEQFGGTVTAIKGYNLSQPTTEATTDDITVNFNSDLAPTVLSYNFEGKQVTQNILPFRQINTETSSTFEFGEFRYDGVLLDAPTDNGTPMHIAGTTLGANHGYAKTRLTQTGHGKTNVDVGSIWTDGTNEWVIVNVLSANQLDVSARNSNNFLGSSINSLSHVSGASNTTVINISAKTNSSFLPALKNQKRKVFADGKEVTDFTKTVKGKKITFTESYDIIEKSSMMEWLITQVGTSSKILELQGDGLVSLNNSFIFDNKMGCTQYMDVLGLKDGVALADIMFMQVMFFDYDSPVQFYIPKTLPLTYNGNSYDFSNKVNMSSFTFNSTSDNIFFTPAVIEDNALTLDRVVKIFNSNLGFSVGFLPIKDGLNRKTLTSRNALEIRGTKKIYMRGVNSASITTINKGDHYQMVGYRKWFTKSTNRTAMYLINSTEGDFLYMDWHEAIDDIVQLPEELVGRKYEIVEKSSSVSIIVRPIEIKALVTGKGFAVIKFI